jgi:putative aminopeptidase FrvX
LPVGKGQGTCFASFWMKKFNAAFLESLLNTYGLSGWETSVQKKWLDYVEPLADKVGADAYGNAYAVVNPSGSPRVLVVGHADEIGYQVQHINAEGFLYIVRVGGTDVSLARGQRVLVHGKKGPITGVIGTIPIHLQSAKGEENKVQIHDLFVDIGAGNKAEALKQVSVGDPITFKVSWDKLGANLYTTRAADNRIGLFAAAETLRLAAELKKSKKLKACVIAVSTIQEENGLYGAGMIGYSLQPDAALVFDVGHATDTPAADYKKHGEIHLGRGPIISRGSVNHPVLVESLIKTATRKKIPYQLATDPRFSGTDADAIFNQRGGVPSAVLSLPNRYMHSTIEVFDPRDLEKMSLLSAAFLESLPINGGFQVKIR